MKVTTIIEHEDGGADVMLEDITPREMEALVQAGFAQLLKEYADQLEAKRKVPAILRGDEK
jgi:hypothetical protein